MSIKNSIANCRKPFAVGSSRQVFYSKKYDVVIKLPYAEGHNSETAIDQTAKEKRLFNSLREEDKKYFPILDFVENRRTGETAIIMKRADHTLEELGYMHPFDNFECFNETQQEDLLKKLKRRYRLNLDIPEFIDMITRLRLIDLHHKNIAIMGDSLVILDFGW